MKKYILFKDFLYNTVMADIKREEPNKNHIIISYDKNPVLNHKRIYFGNFIKCVDVYQYNNKEKREYKINNDGEGFIVDGKKVKYIDILDLESSPGIYEFEDDEVAELFCESIKGELENNED